MSGRKNKPNKTVASSPLLADETLFKLAMSYLIPEVARQYWHKTIVVISTCPKGHDEKPPQSVSVAAFKYSLTKPVWKVKIVSRLSEVIKKMEWRNNLQSNKITFK